MANLAAPGATAVVASCGKFGERWVEIAESFGLTTEHLAFEWGEAVDPARLDRALAGLDAPARVVFTTHSETSTGVVNDVQALAEVARSHDDDPLRRCRIRPRRGRPPTG